MFNKLDIQFGLQIWRQRKAQWVLMVLGFSLFSALLCLTLSMAQPLFSKKPEWVTSNESFISFGLRSHDNRMVSTSIENIESFQQADGISNVAYLGAQQLPLFFDNASSENTVIESTVIYFSENFSELLQVSSLPDFQQQAHASIWLTERFWQQHFNQADVAGRVIYIGVERVPAVINGVLPKQWNQLGVWQADIITSVQNMPDYLNISLAGEEVPAQLLDQLRTQVSRQMPTFFGVAQLIPGYHYQEIKAPANESASSEGFQLSGESKNLIPFIVEGIDFTPEARNVLERQWWMVLGLTIIFGLINALNLLTVSFHELVKRSAEFSIRIAMGARLPHLIRQLCGEQIVSSLAVVVLGACLSYLLSYYAARQHSELLSVQNLFYQPSFIVALVIVVTIMMAFACIPLSYMYRKNNFSRAKGGSASKSQSLLARMNLTLQALLAGTALSLCVVMLSFHWGNLNASRQFNDIFEFKVASSNPASSKGAHTGDWFRIMAADGVELAASAQSFLQPSSPTLEFRAEQPDNPNRAILNIMNVNSRFFALFLPTSSLLGKKPDKQGVVLNEAAAKMLGYENVEQALGKRLFTDNPFLLGFKKDEIIRINGIVANLPHFGVIHQDVAVIYADIELLPPLYQFHVYSHGLNIDKVGAVLSEFIDNRSNWSLKHNAFLAIQFAQHNKTTNFFIYFSLVLAGLTSLIAISAFFYQFRAYVLQRESVIAIHLAMGAKLFDINGYFIKLLIPIIFTAVVGIALFSSVIIGWFERQYHITINSLLVTSAALAFIVLGMVFMALAASWALYHANINDKLRQVDA